jgi:hypothetical protein
MCGLRRGEANRAASSEPATPMILSEHPPSRLAAITAKAMSSDVKPVTLSSGGIHF